jgi:hypothetical protein
MRRRYIQHPETLELIPADQYVAPQKTSGPMILPDIKPYQSMVTGEIIDGRKSHREHLKRHNVVEVGNEPIKPPSPVKPPPGLKETLGRIVYEKLRY